MHVINTAILSIRISLLQNSPYMLNESLLTLFDCVSFSIEIILPLLNYFNAIFMKLMHIVCLNLINFRNCKQ